MEARRYTLKEDRVLLVREATDDDAGAKRVLGPGYWISDARHPHRMGEGDRNHSEDQSSGPDG